MAPHGTALVKGPLVNSSQGGGSKDTWVMEAKTIAEVRMRSEGQVALILHSAF